MSVSEIQNSLRLANEALEDFQKDRSQKSLTDLEKKIDKAKNDLESLIQKSPRTELNPDIKLQAKQVIAGMDRIIAEKMVVMSGIQPQQTLKKRVDDLKNLLKRGERVERRERSGEELEEEEYEQ